MPPVARMTARAGNPRRARRSRGRATMPVTRPPSHQQALADIALEDADRRRAMHRLDQRRHDRRAGHVAVDVHDAPLGMSGLARQGQWPRGRGRRARHSREGRGPARPLRPPSGGRSSRRRCRRRRQSCRRRASRPSRRAPWPRRCRPAPRPTTPPRRSARRRAPSPDAARDAGPQNSPASPPPTMMTSSLSGGPPERFARHGPALSRASSSSDSRGSDRTSPSLPP